MTYRHTFSAALLTAPALIACPADPIATSDPGTSTSTDPASSGTTTDTSDLPTSATTTTPHTTTGTTTAEPPTGDTGVTTDIGDTTATTGPAPLCSTFLCGAPAACCDADDDCVAGTCVAGCDSGVRCGADQSTCCDADQLCVGGTCLARQGACDDPGDCDPGSDCDLALAECVQLADEPACEYVSPTLDLTPGWQFTSDEVIGLPLVVDVRGDDTPEVIVNTMRAKDKPTDYSFGELVCLDGATGEELWRIAESPQSGDYGAHGRSTLAAGDVDGDGRPDIIYPGRPEGANFVSPIYAVDGDGKSLWTSHNVNNAIAKVRVMNGAPALANLDDDPMAEIAYGAAILDHDGLLVWNQNNNGGVYGSPHQIGQPNALLYSGGIPTFADLTGDGHPELLTGREAWTIDWVAGDPPDVTLTMLWKDTSGAAGDGWPAVADLDGNGTPEVVLVAYPDIKVLDGKTGALWCGVDETGAACIADDSKRTQPIKIPGALLGGPAAIADFDGDARLEFALTTGSTFRVFDLHRPSEVIVQPNGESVPAPGGIFTRWRTTVQDASSAATGALAFDADADGKAEVFYQDECYLRVADGASGEVLIEIANSSATIHEYPVVSNVDDDAATDLLVVANLSDPPINAKCLAADPSWTPRKGVYLYHPTQPWAPTRRAWTNHAYHVTNVDSDGNVATAEVAHWTMSDTNGFRQALGGDLAHNAPDLQVSLVVGLESCPAEVVLRATVFNTGELAVAAGIEVTFHDGADAMSPTISTVQTTAPIGPGGSTTVHTILPAPAQPANYFASVDPSSAVGECLEQNNGSLVFGASCSHG